MADSLIIRPLVQESLALVQVYVWADAAFAMALGIPVAGSFAEEIQATKELRERSRQGAEPGFGWTLEISRSR
jgi:hypothetical protein